MPALLVRVVKSAAPAWLSLASCPVVTRGLCFTGGGDSARKATVQTAAASRLHRQPGMSVYPDAVSQVGSSARCQLESEQGRNPVAPASKICARNRGNCTGCGGAGCALRGDPMSAPPAVLSRIDSDSAPQSLSIHPTEPEQRRGRVVCGYGEALKDNTFAGMFIWLQKVGAIGRWERSVRQTIWSWRWSLGWAGSGPGRLFG